MSILKRLKGVTIPNIFNRWQYDSFRCEECGSRFRHVGLEPPTIALCRPCATDESQI